MYFRSFQYGKVLHQGGIDRYPAHNVYRGQKIAMSDYRMWFHLNIKTNLSILTALGETDGATLMNGIGQGSFSAALASSLNIGCAVGGITRGVCSANIGEVELNS